MKKELITYIKKSHIKAVQKFNEELAAFAKETGESPVTLYEDANTSFTLCDITISQDGQLFYTYDGQVDVGGVYNSPEDGYIMGDNGFLFKPYPFTLSAYLKPISN